MARDHVSDHDLSMMNSKNGMLRKKKNLKKKKWKRKVGVLKMRKEEEKKVGVLKMGVV